MKRLRRRTIIALVLAGALAGLASANAPTYETTILFTHDTHDHFLPMPDEEGGEYGGYTRLATLIQQERAAHPDALVLDAGEFVPDHLRHGGPGAAGPGRDGVRRHDAGQP